MSRPRLWGKGLRGEVVLPMSIRRVVGPGCPMALGSSGPGKSEGCGECGPWEGL